MPPQLSDRRVQRTRSALESALLELLGDHDLAQITVRDLTARAEVNRSTFYEHYRSVGDLAASACAALFDELIAAAPHVGGTPGATDQVLGTGALADVFAHVAANARLYGAILGEGGSAEVINHVHRRLAVAVHANLRGAPGDRSRDPLDVPDDPLSVVLAGALLGAILDWLRRGCPGTAAEASAALWPILYGAAAAVLG
ncbi:TetR-like C-terminal domain-containing protein [Actinocorallia longicatena]|uniref:TetR/AcrR family transcriptional regulator C-terminal domain-containing protein n=1 Tax=Actinocorallia longicatena TaxID=111803 RepID=A0ABP6Q790_9ACTN